MQRKEQEFNRIKKGEQTIFLLKTDELSDIIETNWMEDFYIKNKGRLQILINDYDPKINGCNCVSKSKNSHECEPNIIGGITINGYSIIPNYFNELAKKSGSNYPSYQKKFLTDTFKTLNKINLKWIIENVKYLTEQFKNETEILILNVESVS